MNRDAICFIPARGGSKRIPRKNLVPLGGKSLLQRAVEAALETKRFRQVVVSSDDAEVESAVAAWPGVSYHKRSADLANDTARVPEVVHRYLTDLETSERPDVICVVLPPCPFRTARHIEEAYALFEKENPDGFLVSVSPYDFPPQFAVRFQAPGPRLDLVQPEVYATTTRSQSVERLVHPNGAVYLCAVEPFLRTQSFFSEPLIGYEMSPEDSLDVDWPHQFAIAESLFAQRVTQCPT